MRTVTYKQIQSDYRQDVPVDFYVKYFGGTEFKFQFKCFLRDIPSLPGYYIVDNHGDFGMDVKYQEPLSHTYDMYYCEKPARYKFSIPEESVEKYVSNPGEIQELVIQSILRDKNYMMKKLLNSIYGKQLLKQHVPFIILPPKDTDEGGDNMTLNNIYRTITDTRCYGQHVNDHGEFEDFTAAIVGSFDEEKATKVLRKEYADNTIVINRVERQTTKYRLSLAHFIENAEVIEEDEAE